MNLRIPLLFSKAIDLQVDLIELDVHLSADGELFMTRQLTGQPTERSCKPILSIGTETI
jgi:hypothetical protein